jgi:hypothetical protein
VCHQNGGGIILAGVGVDNQADFFRHIDFLRLGWFGAAIIVLINAALVEAGILCQKALGIHAGSKSGHQHQGKQHGFHGRPCGG